MVNKLSSKYPCTITPTPSQNISDHSSSSIVEDICSECDSYKYPIIHYPIYSNYNTMMTETGEEDLKRNGYVCIIFLIFHFCILEDVILCMTMHQLFDPRGRHTVIMITIFACLYVSPYVCPLHFSKSHKTKVRIVRIVIVTG